MGKCDEHNHRRATPEVQARIPAGPNALRLAYRAGFSEEPRLVHRGGWIHSDEKYEREGKVVGAAIKAGRVRLSLSQDDGKKGLDRKKGEGMRIYIATAQEVDGVANAIKGRGGILASEPADMPWGVRAFNLVDPDGFLLTISSEM